MYAHNAAGAEAQEATSEGTGQRAGHGPVLRRLAVLTGCVAVALAVFAGLHLAGSASGRGGSSDSAKAGVPELLICVVLAAASLVLWRGGRRARKVGLYAIGFAIVGFVVGLSNTLRGGPLPDLTFHVTGLTLLLGGFVVLLRAGRPVERPGRGV